MKLYEKLYRLSPEAYKQMMKVLNKNDNLLAWEEAVLVAEEVIKEHHEKLMAKWGLY